MQPRLAAGVRLPVLETMSDSWPVLPLVPEPSSVAMTVAAWLALGEDEPGELVRGRLVEEEVPDATHAAIVAWLLWTLKTWLGPRGLVLGSHLKLLVAEKSGRRRDLVVYLEGSRLPPRKGLITVAPDLLIEVVSPSPRDERRDRVEKMAEYAQFGVRYYWLVDAALGSVEMFELIGGRYSKAVGTTGGVVRDVPGCPALELDVDALWQELARLPENWTRVASVMSELRSSDCPQFHPLSSSTRWIWSELRP